MTGQVGPEQKRQIEQQLEKVRQAIKFKNRQIALKLERARLYDRLSCFVGDETDDDEVVWKQIYALDAATAANDAELLRLDMGDMEAAVTQMEAVLRAVSSGLVVPSVQMPGRGAKHNGK